MKGFAITGVNKTEWKDFPVPKVNPYGALIRPKIVSPCTTDVHLVETGCASIPHLQNRPLGHEMAGIISEVGVKVKDFKVGDLVTVSSCMPEFRSMEAQAGNPKLCNTSQYIMDDPDRAGSFVEQFYVLDADMNLVHIPESVSLEQAVMLTDMATTSFDGIEEMEVQFGDSVAILGIGPVGLMGVCGAVMRGAGKVFAIGSRQVCFDLAKEYGATDFVDYHDGDFTQKVIDLNGGPVDSVLVAGGNAESLTNGFKMVKKGGIVCNVAAYYMDENIVIPNSVWGYGYGEKTLKAIQCGGGRRKMEKLFKLVEYGRLQPEKMITHRFHGMEKAQEALNLFLNHDRTLIKPVIYFD
jgi:threonine dehydrogenase-like Zn-dependent dehydrogenase